MLCKMESLEKRVIDVLRITVLLITVREPVNENHTAGWYLMIEVLRGTYFGCEAKLVVFKIVLGMSRAHTIPKRNFRG